MGDGNGEFCRRFKAIQQQHGDESVAFISTGQMATEEMALLGSLAKFGMGMIHGDGNTRQCMATSVVAYKQAFGFDAPPYSYQDFEESDVILLVGSNLCIAHPIMWQRVCRNPHDPQIIVIDPRKTETAMTAGEHLAIRPKSDLALLYGLANLLLANGWIDERFDVTVGIHCYLVTPWGTDGETSRVATIHDPEGSLHARFAADAACFYLIRPDGSVGERSKPPNAENLVRHLRRLLHS